MAAPASILLYRWRSRWAEDLPVTGFHEVPICSKEPRSSHGQCGKPQSVCSVLIRRSGHLIRAEANNLQLYGMVLDWTKVLYSGDLASD